MDAQCTRQGHGEFVISKHVEWTLTFNELDQEQSTEAAPRTAGPLKKVRIKVKWTRSTMVVAVAPSSFDRQLNTNRSVSHLKDLNLPSTLRGRNSEG